MTPAARSATERFEVIMAARAIWAKDDALAICRSGVVEHFESAPLAEVIRRAMHPARGSVRLICEANELEEPLRSYVLGGLEEIEAAGEQLHKSPCGWVERVIRRYMELRGVGTVAPVAP